MRIFKSPGGVRIEEEFPLDVFTLLKEKAYESFIENTSYSLKESLAVKCLSIPDLVDLKKGTSREKDQLDVTVLRRLQHHLQEGKAPAINLDISSSPASAGLTHPVKSP